MSDRRTTPIKDALAAWRKQTDEAITKLQQRPAGINGLITPGGGAGTFLPIATPFNANWQPYLLNSLYTPQWAVDADGFLHLRGLIGNTSSWQIGVIFTIPQITTPREEYFGTAGFNNSLTQSFSPILNTITGGHTLGLSVAPSVAWAANAFISLSGISVYVGSQ